MGPNRMPAAPVHPTRGVPLAERTATVMENLSRVGGQGRERPGHASGCEVHGYDGSEISLKGDGGPACLTAPIWRA